MGKKVKMNLEKQFNVGREACFLAGEIQLKNFRRKQTLTKKSSRDFATEVDFECEKKIIELLKKNYPNDNFLSEEVGEIKGQNKFLWVIDPLDGTVNYAQGFPLFCVIISLYDRSEERTLLGMVYNPLSEELFSASLGEGAYRNGEKIKVSSRGNSHDCFITSGSLQIDRLFGQAENPENFFKLIKIFLRYRMLGSIGLDLANIARGASDVHIASGKPWDILGPALIIKEAGGEAFDAHGKEIDRHSKEIIACNKNIAPEVKKIFKI